MKIRFKNALILPMSENTQSFYGELWVDGERIEYVGPAKTAEHGFDREIDAQCNLLLPGFKNAHTHSAMTFLRSFADDLPLLDWLQEQVFPMEAKLKAEDIAPLVKLAIMEYLSSGITACFDMYMFQEEVVKASIDCGFRTVLCGAINDYGGTLQQVEENYLRFNDYHPLISSQLGFHAEYTCSRELLEGIVALSKKYKAPVYTHNSEGLPEVMQCIERTGMTPTAYLNSLGIFDYGGGCYHCVHINEEDMDIFAEKNIYAISNPGSNTKLASGIAPLCNMMDKGINLALGTDGAASNNCLDMFREMFLATGLQKLKKDDASAMDADKVLRMATVGGAQATRLTDCDMLEAGKYADICMIDMHQPNMQPINSVSKNVVYSGSKQNVKMTMVNGKILYEDGKYFINEEPESIYQKANEIINRMR